MAAKSKRTTKRRRGRPTRKEASRTALSGVDLTTLDPTTVLRSIAADESAPASARVAAAKALLSGTPKPEEPAERDPIARRALRILQGGKE
ncbi:hypothetical protein [Bradyrhizobium diazoefficiens]|uniref:hypothetical protein n=1 Tax=Bradyrhizobium diazoefficiens TaxID=1355477 RepID=UPI00272CC3EC|nr:hypothetical protein [Bradyrhizobium diazoefficiens]WLA62378.1 hypothetical protein QNN01_28350 [Bradyrhizobium diazoefficiens]